ncbi:unnamed protein product [Penicillium camemberti]|uniref:Str. FM013 n=1 Tax=Penicillium camemberti (strain FM 013) TaxID=1429867 RepID=A0A0G4PEE6_PENC3|nr:unnamed protein product [Penicillium camemberti]
MEQFADELFGDGFSEYPLLLRPVYGTIILVIEGSKLFFYILLPAIAAYAILMGAVGLLVISILHIADMAGNLRKNDDGTRKKNDDDNRVRGSVERRLEAGEIKF